MGIIVFSKKWKNRNLIHLSIDNFKVANVLSLEKLPELLHSFMIKN